MQPLVLGAVVRGPSHQAGDQPCQDALAWTRLGAHGAAVAIADGAGSARHAEVGADAAVCSAVAAVRIAWSAEGDGHLPALCRAGAFAARTAVIAHARALEARPRDLACTLIVAVWMAEAVAAAHIGDGAVVGCRAGAWNLLAAPAAGEYVNETRFLTDGDWETHLQVTAAHRGLEGFVAFTDGCQRAALRRATGGFEPFEGFLEPVGRFARRVTHAADGERQLLGLLDSMKMRAASDDDKTLALVWRRART